DQIVGKTDTELFPPDAARTYQANDRKLLQGSRPLRCEERVASAEGDRIYLAIKSLVGPGGMSPAIYGIALGLTEQKQLEEQLRTRKEFLESRGQVDTEAFESRLGEALRQAEQRWLDRLRGIEAIFWEAEPQAEQFSLVAGRGHELLGYPAERWRA